MENSKKTFKDKQNHADKVSHLIPQKGVYYVCIKDYYSADGKTLNTKGKTYKSPCDGYINDDKGLGLSWINSCTEKYFRPLQQIKA
jgi:hypothetical protein